MRQSGSAKEKHQAFAAEQRRRRNEEEVRLYEELAKLHETFGWNWEWQSERFAFLRWFPDFYEPNALSSSSRVVHI
jgi:hypothetical protein